MIVPRSSEFDETYIQHSITTAIQSIAVDANHISLLGEYLVAPPLPWLQPPIRTFDE